MNKCPNGLKAIVQSLREELMFNIYTNYRLCPENNEWVCPVHKGL